LIYFSTCILDNREPEPAGEEGLIDVQIMRAAYRSAEVGRAVPVQANHAARRPEPAQQIHCPPAEEPQLLRAELPSGSSNQ